MVYRRPSRARGGNPAPVDGSRPVARASTHRPGGRTVAPGRDRSEEHTSELQSRGHLVCRLLLEKKILSIVVLGLPGLVRVLCRVAIGRRVVQDGRRAGALFAGGCVDDVDEGPTLLQTSVVDVID